MSVLLRKALEAGDQVIAHTPASKKPIWANKGADHPAYSGYSAADHIVAANVHANRAKELNIASSRAGGSMTLKRQAAQSTHFATTHRQAGMGQTTRLAASMAAKGQTMQASDIYRVVLAKAAGDRGGQVIGRTKSGGIVYAKHSASSSRYKAFSGQDHKDAANLHHERAKARNSAVEHEQKYGDHQGEKAYSLRHEARHHSEMAHAHDMAAASK